MHWQELLDEYYSRIREAGDRNDHQAAADISAEALDDSRFPHPLPPAAHSILLQYQGYATQRLGRFDEAWGMLFDAVGAAGPIAEELRRDRCLGNAYHLLADIHFDRKETALAELCLRRAVEPLRGSEQFDILSHVLIDLAELAKEREETEPFLRYMEDAFAAAERSNDLVNAARAALGLSKIARHQVRTADAENWLQKAWEYADASNNSAARINLLLEQGRAANENRHHDEATRFFCEALRVAEEAGDVRRGAIAHLYLGRQTEYEKERTRKDIDHFEKAVVGFRDNDADNLLRALYLLSYAYGYHRDFAAARRHLVEYFRVAQERKEKARIVWGLRQAACVAAKQRRRADAIRLFGASERIAEEMEPPPMPSDYERDWIRLLQRFLGGVRFQARWTAGRALSVAEAIALATREPPAGRWFPLPRRRTVTNA
jgi:tetratricopeptide (TPR) repeat protein